MYKPDETHRKLQLRCVEILKVVHKICVDNDIQYSLCGGSVVGAHLYGGVIPWDDDVDLMMTRENYNKFIKVCKTQLPSQYIIQNYRTNNSYYSLFTKIIDTNSTLIQPKPNGEEIVSGIFLDITVYDKVPNNFAKKIDFFFMKLCLWLFFANDYNNKPRRLIKKIIGKNEKYLYLLAEKIFVLNSHFKNYSYSELFGAFCNRKPYEPRIFENYDMIKFEDGEYMIVRDYVDYLVCRYERTDFYEPEEKQVPTHYSKVDFENSYLN